MQLELFAKIKNAKFFSELDLAVAFHQIGVKENSKKILCFTSLKGMQYIWNCMPFGPKDVPTHFQKIMGEAMKDFFNFIVVYIDNILVFSENIWDHVSQLIQIVKQLSSCGFKLNVEKCKLGFEEYFSWEHCGWFHKSS